jgi:hypothetical protein
MNVLAATRLLAIAGELPRYVVMCRTGSHKYAWRDRALTLADAGAHLTGRQTVGAELRRHDGRTYALAWDVDDTIGWQGLTAAAVALARSGARPLLVRSPAQRGGHLWLLFADPIDPLAGHAAASAIVPALAKVGEHWPRPDRQAIRLPGGWYQTQARGVHAAGWCQVAVVPPVPPVTWVAGPAVGDLLLYSTTPAPWLDAWLPHNFTANPPAPAPAHRATVGSDRPAAGPAGARPLPAAAADPGWQVRHGTQATRLYFWFTATDVAAWFNARYTARDLLPPEASGYGRATWRGERTASVTYRPDGGWVDHGAGGRTADGHRDGGDALALYCRVNGLSRSQALHTLARELIVQARADVEAAARAGRPPADWVAALLSPAGWRYYDAHRAAQAPAATAHDRSHP